MKPTLYRAAIWSGLAIAGIASPALVRAAPATIAGTVRDVETGEPLPGAVVTLPELHRTSLTDVVGQYTLAQVPAGPHQVSVRSMGYALHSLRALVPETGTLEIDVALHPEPVLIPPLEIRSQVPVRGGDDDDFPNRQCSAMALKSHPFLAEPDAFQALSGGEVVLAPESPSGVHIRGGSSDETAYLLDGIPAFQPFHAAGMASAWNPDALSRLDLSASAPPLTGQHALAGTIAGVTRTPGPRLSAQGSVSTTQGRITLDGPLGVAGAGYLLSAREGFHDALAPQDEASYVRGGSRDWLAKIELPALGGRLKLLTYDSRNDLNSAAAADVEGPDPDPRNTFEWQSESWGAGWRREAARTAVEVHAWSAAGEAESRWMTKGAALGLEAERRDLGLRAGVERRSARATTQIELRLDGSQTNYHLVADSAAAPLLDLDARTPVATLLAQQSRTLRRDLQATLGASLAWTGSASYLGPAVEIRYALSPAVTLSSSLARAHQFSQSLRNAESVVGNLFPVDLALGAGAPQVPVAWSDQGVIGCEIRPRPSVRLGLQAYARASDQLLLVAPREGAPFTTGSFVTGSGSARGLAAELTVSRSRYGLVASYGWQRVRLYENGTSYVPDHGASHLLESGLTFLPSRSWTLRLGATGEFGRRTTPISGGLEWEACNLLDQGCEFGGSPYQGNGPLGGAELPAYFRVDLGVRKEWHWRAGDRDALVALFGTATNILGRKNVLTYAEATGTGQRVAVEMRPPSPLVLGLDWRF